MNFINEERINVIIDELNDDNFEELMINFSESQPFLLSFLLSEGFNVLDEDEKSLLFYLAVIIYFSVEREHSDIELVPINLIERTDEENWTIVDQNKFKTLKEIADHFFTDYNQEDLLAFVEDALVEDEEYEISNIGRNVIFVSMKSLIDALSLSLE